MNSPKREAKAEEQLRLTTQRVEFRVRGRTRDFS